jgi:phosphatidylglycerol lysyltransferase
MSGFSLHRLMPFIGIILFSIALLVIWHSLKAYPFSQIQHALYSIPPMVVVQTIGVALLGYVMLSGYDWLALRYAGEKLPYRKVLFASFLGYAISNNVGQPLVSGGAMRYRLYSNWGLTAGSIARIILFCSASYVVGAVTLLVAAYFLSPSGSFINDRLSHTTLLWIVSSATLLLCLWWGMVILYHHKPLRIKKFELFLPTPTLAIQQTTIALLDVLIASLVLYLPFHATIPIDFLHFLMLYIMAQLLALSSQVPGGIGVFEGSFLFLTKGMYDPSQVLAALILCRISYYFIPLVLAGVALTIYETRNIYLTRYPRG